MNLYINEISIEKKVYRKIKFPEGSSNKQYNYGDMCIGHNDSRVFLYNRNMESENQFGMIAHVNENVAI